MQLTMLGLGAMGAPMARNLIQAGHSVTVYNRTTARAEPFRALGARVSTTPADAVRGAEAALTMVSDDRALEDVLANGVLDALPRGAVHISMSTVSVTLSQRLVEEHRAKGQHYIAAPVFGRPDAAAARKLFVVAAGPAPDIDRCRPALDSVGQKIFVVGDAPEAANVVKLAGNFMITAAVETMAEAMAFVGKNGVDTSTFIAMITDSLFGAPIYRTYSAMLLSDTYEPAGFKLPLAIKDNRLLLAAAEGAAVPMPLASLIRDRMLAALAHGLGESDWSAIARMSGRL